MINVHRSNNNKIFYNLATILNLRKLWNWNLNWFFFCFFWLSFFSYFLWIYLFIFNGTFTLITIFQMFYVPFAHELKFTFLTDNFFFSRIRLSVCIPITVGFMYKYFTQWKSIFFKATEFFIDSKRTKTTQWSKNSSKYHSVQFNVPVVFFLFFFLYVCVCTVQHHWLSP